MTASSPLSAEHQVAAAPAAAAALGRAIQAIRLYGVDHPATARAAAALCGAVGGLGASGELVLQVSPDGFRAGAVDLPRDPDGVEAARLLSNLRVGSVRLSGAITAPDVVALVSAISGKAVYGRWAADDGEALEAATGGRVRLGLIDYGSLRLAQDGDAGETGGFDWSWLHGESETGTNVDAVALALEQRLARTDAGPHDLGEESVNAGPIRAGMARAVRAGQGQSRARSTTRVAAVLDRLSPAARARLTDVGPAPVPTALGDLADLAGSLDSADLVAALEAVSDPRSLLNIETVRVVGTVARQAPGDGALAAQLLRTVRRAAEVSDTARPIASVLGAMASLLDRSCQSGVNPEEYDRLLATLAAGRAEPRASDAPAVLPIAWEDPEYHAAMVCGELALSPDTAAHDAAGLFQVLSGSIDLVLDRAGVRTVAEIARAGDRFLGGPHCPATTSAVKQLLLSLQTPERLGRVLDAAPPGSEHARHAVDLVALLGPDALVQSLRVRPPRPDIASLLQHPGVDGRALLARLAATDVVCATVLMGSRVLPALLQERLADLLIEHADPAVTASAFAALHSAGAAWPIRRIEGALAHSSDTTRLLGIEHARAITVDERVPLLTRLVTGTPPTDLSLRVLAAATRALCEAGPTGVAVVVNACAALLRRPTRSAWRTLQAMFDTTAACHRLSGAGPRDMALVVRIVSAAIAGPGRAA